MEAVKLRPDDELIKAAHLQSIEAHKHGQPYVSNKTKHGAASSSSSSSSTEVIIFAFQGLSEIDDWYHDNGFGETYVDSYLFPSLRSIGENRDAKVNGAFLRRFQDLLSNTGFKLEVEKAVIVDKKKILLTGHLSGGAIASFATLWMLDEYTRKRGIKSTICCITFGSPLIGDKTLSHAVQREKWASHFTHFIMERDIVPRIMLAPKASIQEHLPKILNIFRQIVNPTNHKFLELSRKKFPKRTTPHDQLLKPDEAVTFFENVVINASTVANQDALDLMGSTSSLKDKLSADFVEVSPYRPFGCYVFWTRDEANGPTRPRQQLVVENPNSVLHLLFLFLQLQNEDDSLAEFALDSLNESLSYEEEINRDGLQLQDMVFLKELNEHLLTDNEVCARNKAVFKLTSSAKRYLMDIEEAEKIKNENEAVIKSCMRKYTTKGTSVLIIEDILDEIRKYKEKQDKGKTNYYDAFKLQNNQDAFLANVRRLQLAKIYDDMTEMVMTKDLPDEFEVWDEWVDLATLYRRLVEPLEIANYYRLLKGDNYMTARPERYKFVQRWYEHANAMGFEMISESNFIAEVEELMREIEEPRNTTLEEIKARFESIKVQVQKWKSDDKIPNEDVYWGESTLSMLEEKLS